MDQRNFAIGILSTTAVILLVGVLLVQSRPRPALASGVTTSGGNYVMTVGSVSIDDEELLYLIDAPKQKLVIYRFDAGKKEIEVVQGISLEEMRAATGGTQGQRGNQPTRGRSRRGGRP